MTTVIEHIPAGTTEPPLPDGVWRIDPRRSEIGFAVTEMWGLRTVRGVFGKITETPLHSAAVATTSPRSTRCWTPAPTSTRVGR